MNDNRPRSGRYGAVTGLSGLTTLCDIERKELAGLASQGVHEDRLRPHRNRLSAAEAAIALIERRDALELVHYLDAKLRLKQAYGHAPSDELLAAHFDALHVGPDLRQALTWAWDSNRRQEQLFGQEPKTPSRGR